MKPNRTQRSEDDIAPAADGLAPGDTSMESALKQIEVFRKMSVEDKARMTFELSNNVRSVVKSGIRMRHPDYTPEQVTMAVLKLTLEPQVFKEAFGDCEIVP